MFAALTGRSLTSQTHPAHWCAPCSARAFGMALPLDKTQTPRFRSRLIDNFRPNPPTVSRPHWLMACICTFVTQVGVSAREKEALRPNHKEQVTSPLMQEAVLMLIQQPHSSILYETIPREQSHPAYSSRFVSLRCPGGQPPPTTLR